ncbi:MAG: hypothetical protein ACJ8C4_16165 [Gemmataceae bacterium]
MNGVTRFLLVAALITGATIAHGYVTGRWTAHASQASYALPALPQTLGNWRGEEVKSDLGIDQRLTNLTRRYTRGTRSFTISLTVGPAGLAAQHTPEYCYPSSGYHTVGTTLLMTVPDRADVFRNAVYRTEFGDAAQSLRILWAWNADGNWVAPRYPELQFLGRVALRKLYVVSADADRAPEDDAELQDFLKQLLAALHDSQFSSPPA